LLVVIEQNGFGTLYCQSLPQLHRAKESMRGALMKKIAGPRLGASLSLILICPLSAHAAEPNSPTSANVTELRSTALAATQQGRPEQALPVYDTLTALEHIDPQVFQEAHLAAMRAHDFHRSAMYGERQLSSAPNNFSVMSRSRFPIICPET
jgi:hypothetical protein